ncbi:MAG: glycerol-3-phosphate 1-O-acyltransferase PlsY [Candidatus Omnitrophica bacterium]|nr:glycerol-3-phosphate 1-O-acyltransferase PlsY [Candidatus Omnitrophota bacterium]
MGVIILLVLSYLIGGIPFGFLVVYLVKKADIRGLGSGNIGATNVTRVLGKKWGISVFILDFLKGFIAPLLVPLFMEEASIFVYILTIIAAVCGHNWTPFLKFKGGKGVSTSLGGIAGLSIQFSSLRIIFLAVVFIWVVVFFISKVVSLASLASAFFFFIFSFTFSLPVEFKVFSFLLFVFILIRHKKNIKNILEKKESRF